MRTGHRIVNLGITVSVMVALSACGPSSDAGAKSSSKATSTSKITGNHVPKFVGVQHPLPSGRALANRPDMYKDVLQTGCASVPGGWQTRGTAENTTARPLAFKVLVFFTDAQARIIDSASTTVTVGPKKKATWTAERQFKAPKGTQCVVRAVTRG